MNKNSLFAYSIRWCTVLFLTLPLTAQTFSWGTLGTSAERKCLHLSVASDGSILAGSDAGLFRSLDNGITWKSCGLDSFQISYTVIDSVGRFFAAVGRNYLPKGIYRSEDGGNSWQKIVESNGNALLSVTNEIILIASHDGILRSTDHGNSWNNVHTPSSSLSEQGIYSLCINRDGTIYAGTMSNILRSTDQGKSWTVSIQIGSYNYLLAAGNFGDVFTFSMAQNGHAYLYRTIDQGGHWTQYYPELYENGVSFVLENGKWVQYGPGFYHLLGIIQDLYRRSFIICSNRKDSVVVMGTNGNILQSLVLANAGSLFQGNSISLAITADGHCLIGVSGNSNGGIYRSVNPITSPSLPSLKISQVVVDADHDLKPDSIGKTVTIVGVINSTNLQGSEGTQYTLQDGTGGIQLFKNSVGGQVLKLRDAVAVTGTIAYDRGTTQIIPASLHNSDLKIIDSNQALVITSLTVQQFWADPEKYESQLVKVAGIAKKSSSVAWPNSGSDANMVFWNGWDTMIVHINKNTNLAGATEPMYPANVTGVVSQFTSSTSIYNDGYQLSPNNPTDFESGIQVLPNPHFALVTPSKGATLLIDSTNQKFLFAWGKPVDLNGDPLAFRWVPIGGTAVATGGSPTGADSFLVRTGAQLLTFLANKDTAVLQWTVQTKDPFPTIISNVDTSFVTLIKGKTLDVKATENLLPTVFSLDQNYPNPFNPTTVINYRLPITGFVSLKVYDALGREVAALVNEQKNAGTYSIQWNASQFSSGIYFAKMTAGSFSTTKKLILMK